MHEAVPASTVRHRVEITRQEVDYGSYANWEVVPKLSDLPNANEAGAMDN